MKIVYILAGVGDAFYCQSCIRNLDLIDSLRQKGHQVSIAPLYLPFLSDDPGEIEIPVFFGALSVYLKEKLPQGKNIPAWLRKSLDSKWLLKWISKNTGSTEPQGLEEMTISVMKGENGKHKSELNRLVKWLKTDVKPDVVHLSTALLIGIGEKVKKELNIPVFSTIQDEDAWIDNMQEPFPREAWEVIAQGANRIDALISPSAYYADFVSGKTGISRPKINVVPLGITLSRYKKRIPDPKFPVIGFLSRMSDSLGLDILVKAFFNLKESEEFKSLKLKIYGGIAPTDKKLVNKIRRQIHEKGYDDDVEIETQFNLEYVEKLFDSLTLLCVPVPEGEAFGLYLLEAMASGIPVIQPDLGAYPEIIMETGGGLVYQDNTPHGLAEVLRKVLSDPDKISQMSNQGYDAVHRKYSIETTADNLLKLYNGKKSPTNSHK